MQSRDMDTEKYKQELMKLYGRRSLADEPVEQNRQTADAPDDTAYSEFTDENGTEDYNSRYPEPDLSGLDTDAGTVTEEDSVPPEYYSEAFIGSEKGYILVNVRTGEDSSAVSGAAVSVIAVVDGKRLILASGLTDESGVSPRFELPVPDSVHSGTPDPSERPYALFDVTITAEGFFRARSVDVPVFSGITSVQNFNLIPLPLMMNSADDTVTYYNAEPSFGSGKE